MKKFLLTMALALIAGVTMAQNAVEFTFTRNGNGADVTVNGKEGVTASITATSASNAWNTGGAMASRTDVLCPNTNTSATSESSPITYTLTVEGLNSTVTGVAFTHIAVNSGGNLQPSNDTDIRHCNFNLEANENTVGTITDENIWIPSGSTEKTITFDGLAVEANGTLTIKLTLYKGASNNGCFYGLTGITLTTEVVEPEPTPVAAFYHLSGKNLTATELMAKTEPTYIAIKGLAQGNNVYYNYTTNATNTSQELYDQTNVFIWEPVTAGTAGSYYLKKLNAGYMQTSAPGDFADSKENAAVFTAVKPTEVTSGANGSGQFNKDTNSNGYIAAAGGYDYIVRFVKGDNWLNIGAHVTSAQKPAYNNGYGTYTIYQICELKGFDENINITIKNTGDVDYATFYSNAPVQMPEGVTAYYVKEDGINNGYITLTADEDGIIAGNTGVILSATVDTDAEVALTVLGANVAQENGNLLKGTAEDTVINEAAYVLGNKEGIGLYKAETTDVPEGSFRNNAGKAYLPASAVPASAALSAGFRFDFGGNTTGVEEVEIRNEKEEIYDLTGRRVNEITKAGVYIINGKKVMVK